jgi:hypothetical protein
LPVRNQFGCAVARFQRKPRGSRANDTKIADQLARVTDDGGGGEAEIGEQVRIGISAIVGQRLLGVDVEALPLIERLDVADVLGLVAVDRAAEPQRAAWSRSPRRVTATTTSASAARGSRRADCAARARALEERPQIAHDRDGDERDPAPAQIVEKVRQWRGAAADAGQRGDDAERQRRGPDERRQPARIARGGANVIGPA